MSAGKYSFKGSKVLIIEPKLIRNRGHHHTQIAALKALFPDHQLHLIAGEGYDGFAGDAAATFSKPTLPRRKFAGASITVDCGKR